MSEWKKYVLKDVIEKFIDYRGKTPKKTTSGIPLITAKIVKGGRTLEPNEFIDKDDYYSWMTRGFPEINDLVITTEAPLGEVALIKDKGVALAQRIITLQTKKDVCDSIFLKYYFQNGVGQNILQSRASGTTVEGIKSAELKEVQISLPSLSEQKRIAETLISIDDKIDLLHRQNKTLEELAETLFRSSLVEQETWETVPLQYVTKRITDGAHHSPPTTEFGLPMASVKDMYDWGIDISSCRKIAEENYYELIKNDCRPLKDDIVIAKDGSYLKHIFVSPTDLDVVILSSIAILRPNGKYHPLLLTTFLKMKSTRESLANIVTGGVIPRIVLKDFRKFPIKLLPIEVQTKAVQNIEPIYRKCWNNDNQIKLLTQLRDSLMPKLMSGEVRVESVPK